MDNAITAIIFTMGAMTVALSGYACFQFERFRRKLSNDADRLSRAISLQLLGESVIGFGTLVFATGEFTGAVDHWEVSTKSFLRFIMFLATAITTYHLVNTLTRLRNELA